MSTKGPGSFFIDWKSLQFLANRASSAGSRSRLQPPLQND